MCKNDMIIVYISNMWGWSDVYVNFFFLVMMCFKGKIILVLGLDCLLCFCFEKRKKKKNTNFNKRCCSKDKYHINILN